MSETLAGHAVPRQREILSALRPKGKEMLVKIATENDTNGNPRRGWLRTTASGQVLGWIEEGYLGRGAIDGYDDGETPTIYVKPSEYKRFKKWGETVEASLLKAEA